jgi:hypothetical protein
MKEDILEQLVDDYLMSRGYFTRHNIKFKPRPTHLDYDSRKDSVSSDIDLVAINLHLQGTERVVVASCKAWQGGFDPARKAEEVLGDGRTAGREAWKLFRELAKPKWSEAFIARIEEITGVRTFTYWTVVTQLRNAAARSRWENNPQFKATLDGNPIRIVTLNEILNELWAGVTTTPAASTIGRYLQVMKASGWRPGR